MLQAVLHKAEAQRLLVPSPSLLSSLLFPGPLALSPLLALSPVLSPLLRSSRPLTLSPLPSSNAPKTLPWPHIQRTSNAPCLRLGAPGS